MHLQALLILHAVSLSASVRVKVSELLSSESGVGATPFNLAEHALSPFHMVVDILNKDEVMAAKVGNWWGVSAAANYMVSEETFASKISEKLVDMLPKQLKDSAGIDMTVSEVTSEKGGTHFVLEAQILGLDMATLAQKGMGLDAAGADEFAEVLARIIADLEAMGMSDKASAIQDKIADKVRNKIMGKMLEILPEKLALEGVKIKMQVPEYESKREVVAEVAQPAKLGLGEPFWLEATIDDRRALLDDTIDTGRVGGRLKKFVGGLVSDAKFNALVAKKLEASVPQALFEKAGISCSCERDPDEKTKILVKIVIQSFDQAALLTMAKGADFSKAFGDVLDGLESLAGLGLDGMQNKMDGITHGIAGTVVEKVEEKLQEVLAEKLHATVHIVADPEHEAKSQIAADPDEDPQGNVLLNQDTAEVVASTEKATHVESNKLKALKAELGKAQQEVASLNEAGSQSGARQLHGYLPMLLLAALMSMQLL